MKISRSSQKLKILDFDIENRPLSYWYDGKCTSEITAIGMSPVRIGVNITTVVLQPKYSVLEMLEEFLRFYNFADIVTGHYIRKHDLPLINGACFENGLPPLSPKMTIDTHGDLCKYGGIPKSQEYVADLYELVESKYHMRQKMWRQANRFEPDGIKLARKRVGDDVVQHKALLSALHSAGWLKQPRLWKP